MFARDVMSQEKLRRVQVSVRLGYMFASSHTVSRSTPASQSVVGPMSFFPYINQPPPVCMQTVLPFIGYARRCFMINGIQDEYHDKLFLLWAFRETGATS